MNTASKNQFAGTTADVDKAKTFFSMLPSLRDTSLDDDGDISDYMRKAAMDDILKAILERVAGRNADICFTISCIRRNPTQYLSPEFMYQFINWCLDFVSINTYDNGWFEYVSNLGYTRALLEPVLAELAEEAGYEEY